MDNETKEILSDLIRVLLVSNTTNYDDGENQHDHNLFDNVDTEALKDLYDKIN